MPLVKDGQPVENTWVTLGDGDAVPADGAIIVTLARWTAEKDALSARTAPVGVEVPGTTPAADLAADLGRLGVIAIRFPIFRDGRGFSLARDLRERHGYAGEIRAVGHTLPDQYQFLIRCGFSTVEPPDGKDPALWTAAHGAITVAYQASIGEESPLGLLRRRFTGS